MASKPKTMDTLIEVLKLVECGYALKVLEKETGISRTTIKKYLQRLGGRKIASFTTAELADILYNNDTTVVKSARYQSLLEHFNTCSKELGGTGVTRQLLWLEYKEANPQGYAYSQYCEHLRTHLKNRDVILHLEHNPGQEMMIDYAGDKMSYVDMETGEVIACNVFVATLPYSGLTFCVASRQQRLQDVVYSLGQALRYFGGVSKVVLSDNMKTLVTRSDRYEPVFTDLCHQLSAHYGNVFQATRPAKPRDKGMVEGHVKIIYQQVYAPLRKCTFYSLESMNEAIRERLEALNQKPYKNSSESRWTLYTSSEKEHMLPLPNAVFVMKSKVTLKVQRNYHVQLSEDHHYYSVPYIHVGQKVDVLFDQRTVEIYLNHERVALHHRLLQRSCYHTQADHMPSNHLHVVTTRGFTRQEFLLKAEKVGPSTLAAIELVLQSSPCPEQNYKSCNGVLMLVKLYGPQRVEAACNRILQGSRVNYTLIKNILTNGTDKLQDVPMAQPIVIHENLRGPQHYQ